MNISNSVKVSLVQVAQASGTSQIDATAVDMSGHEGVMFFCSIGTANAGNILKAQEATDDATFNDLAGSGVIATTNGQVAYIDVYRPADRYVRPAVVRGVATAIGDIYAVQYSNRAMPQENNIAGIIAGVLLISPEEGQA